MVGSAFFLWRGLTRPNQGPGERLWPLGSLIRGIRGSEGDRIRLGFGGWFERLHFRRRKRLRFRLGRFERLDLRCV